MITPEQLERRRHYLCSTDMSALFVDDEGKSLNPFANAHDIYIQKVFELEPEKKETKPQKMGNRYEDDLIEFAGEEILKPIITDPKRLEYINTDILANNGKPFFMTHLDGFVEDSHDIIEAKSTGMTQEYGDPYTDEIPMRTIIQVHTSFLCTGWSKAWVPALLGKFGLQEEMYVVECNKDIINAIIKAGLDFWNNHVIPKIPPEQTEAGNVELFKRIIRQPETFAEIDGALLTKWEQSKQARLDAEKSEKAAWADVLLQLGDAEGAYMPDGRMLTYFKQKGADIIDRDALKTKYADVYKEVAKENTYRVARLKKA